MATPLRRSARISALAQQQQQQQAATEQQRHRPTRQASENHETRRARHDGPPLADPVLEAQVQREMLNIETVQMEREPEGPRRVVVTDATKEQRADFKVWMERQVGEKEMTPQSKLNNLLIKLGALQEGDIATHQQMLDIIDTLDEPDNIRIGLKLFYSHTAHFEPRDQQGRDIHSRPGGHYTRGNASAPQRRDLIDRSKAAIRTEMQTGETAYPINEGLVKELGRENMYQFSEYVPEIAHYTENHTMHTGSLGLLSNAVKATRVTTQKMHEERSSRSKVEDQKLLTRPKDGLAGLTALDALVEKQEPVNYHDELLSSKAREVAKLGEWVTENSLGLMTAIQADNHPSIIIKHEKFDQGTERALRERTIGYFNEAAKELGFNTQLNHRGSFGFLHPTASSVAGPVRIWPGAMPEHVFSSIMKRVTEKFIQFQIGQRLETFHNHVKVDPNNDFYQLLDMLGDTEEDSPEMRKLVHSFQENPEKFDEFMELQFPRTRTKIEVPQIISDMLENIRTEEAAPELHLDTPEPGAPIHIRALETAINYTQNAIKEFESSDTNISQEMKEWLEERLDSNLRKAGFLLEVEDSYHTEEHYLKAALVIENLTEYSNLLLAASDKGESPVKEADAYEVYFNDTMGTTSASEDEEDVGFGKSEVFYFDSGMQSISSATMLGDDYQASPEDSRVLNLDAYFEYKNITHILGVKPIDIDSGETPNIVIMDLSPVYTKEGGEERLRNMDAIRRYKFNDRVIPIFDITNTSLSKAKAILEEAGYKRYIIVESLTKHHQLGNDKFTLGRAVVVGDKDFIRRGRNILNPISESAHDPLLKRLYTTMNRQLYGHQHLIN